MYYIEGMVGFGILYITQLFKKVKKKPKSNFWFNLGSYWLRELDLNQRPSGYEEGLKNIFL